MFSLIYLYKEFLAILQADVMTPYKYDSYSLPVTERLQIAFELVAKIGFLVTSCPESRLQAIKEPSQ